MRKINVPAGAGMSRRVFVDIKNAITASMGLRSRIQCKTDRQFDRRIAMKRFGFSVQKELLDMNRNISIIVLMLPAYVASAAGQMTWSAQMTYTPTGQTWSTSQTYPTKPAAIAAVTALGLYGPAQVQLYLSGETIVSISPTQAVYRSSIPNIHPTPTPWQYSWTIPGQGVIAYPSVAAADAVGFVHSSLACTNFTVTPTGTWGSSLTGYYVGSSPNGSFEAWVGSSRSYSEQYPTDQNCSIFQTYNGTGYQFSTITCPNPYFGISAPVQPPLLNSTYCSLPISVTATGNLLECPNNGSPSTSVGDPCDVSTGDFSQSEVDVSVGGIVFQRHYHSVTLESGHTLGVGWTHNYAAYLVFTNGTPTGLLRPNGHHDAIALIGGNYESLSGAAIHVQQSGTNWIAYLKDGSSEVYSSTGQLNQLVTPGGIITTLTYNASNQLTSVADPFGHSLQFGYNPNNQIQQVIDSAGHIISYLYDSKNNLTSATYQDGSIRTYLYENTSFPNHLTGILDESSTRFLTVNYDPTTGAVTSSQQAGGAQAVSISYGSNTAVATDSLGAINTYTFTTDSAFAPRVTNFSRNALTQAFAVPTGATDPQRRVTQSTDANSNVTKFSYDSNHLMSKTEAYGTPQARTTGYQYLSINSALPTLITEPLRTTSLVYYPGTNNVHIKTITDPATGTSRIWTYTYNSYGQALTIDGPRTDVSDVTTYAYYTCTTGNECGQIHTIMNASSQVTTFNSYNAFGQPLTITDSNGVVTTLIYDLRLRVTSRQVGSETTGYTYYSTGLLKLVTLADGSTIRYTYDGAHRLTDITDGLGNHVHSTLDGMGNHTADNAYDPSNALRRTHTRVINALNELYQDISAAGTSAVTTTLGYDNNGNLTSNAAPLSRNTGNTYDALNRLSHITDPNGGMTVLGYDAEDNLASVQDPRSLTTSYMHNGFGDVTQIVSPDAGTSGSTYDSGGNLKTTTDARGALATYAYDALNRVIQVAYTDQTINFGYDTGTNGVGRLTSASDANHSMSWTYDTLGRVNGKGQTVGSVSKSVGYAYTNGDLVSMVTPSGQTITYGYTNHRITSIAVNGTSLLSGVTYDPFGPANFWAWGDGVTFTRNFNTDGNLSTIMGGSTITLGYDNALRTTSAGDTYGSGYTWTLGYDSLDRINSASKSGTTLGWTYDSNGNRLTQTGTAASTFTPSTTSNELGSVTGSLSRSYGYDASGNTQSYSNLVFSFNKRGRMSGVTVGGLSTSYFYNALGQLYEKNVSGTVTFLVYDETGHLLGEYTSTGALIQETVWMGDIPVATLRPNGSGISLFYVQTDQLNAPRSVSRTSDHRPMWRWDPDTFGTTAPNQNPYGLGTFVYNLRFPGQYYQAETALNYNYFRDYDPQTGRYIESDPIGLRGGSYSTYTYVNADPIALVDPSGLVHWDGAYNYTSGGLAHFGAGVAATGFTFVLKSECVGGKKAIARVDALAGGAGTGLSLFGPLSIGASTVSFEDNLSSLNPNIFEGDFSYSNAGTIFGSITGFALGGAIGDGSGLNISTSIIDISGGRGKSHLTWARFQDCGCDTNK